MEKQIIDVNFFKHLTGSMETTDIPNKLLAMMIPYDKNNALDNIIGAGVDLNSDFLRDFFEEVHAERSARKQDFTPSGVSQLISHLQKHGQRYFETAAGIGGLVVGEWVNNHDIIVDLEEISGVALAYLLLNLSIRNITGTVKHGDSITGEVYSYYILTKGDKFSDIEIVDNIDQQDTSADMSSINPPFSLKWDGAKGEDENGYPYPPKNYADYLFILRALSKLNDDGQLIAVVPHGLLFRGGKEGEIRKKLVDNKHIKAIIGLPSNLFSGTPIPVALLVLTKVQTNGDIMIIDASNGFEKGKNQNYLNEDHISKIVETYNDNNDVDKYAHVTSIDEIKENDYNLNIPRYVDAFEDEPEIDLAQVTADLLAIDNEINDSNKELLSMLDDMVGTTPESDAMLQMMKGNLKKLW